MKVGEGLKCEYSIRLKGIKAELALDSESGLKMIHVTSSTTSPEKFVYILENYMLLRYICDRFDLKMLLSENPGEDGGIMDNDTLCSKQIRRKYAYAADDGSLRYKSAEHRRQNIYSDILSILEYYTYRFTSVNNSAMDDYILQLRYMMAEYLHYSSKLFRKNNNKDIGSFQNPFRFTKSVWKSINTFTDGNKVDARIMGRMQIPESFFYDEKFDMKIADKNCVSRKFIIYRTMGICGLLERYGACDICACIDDDAVLFKDLGIKRFDDEKNYVSINILINYLMCIYKNECPAPLRYMIDCDIRDMENNNICSYDSFIGNVGVRPKRLKADSDISLVYRKYSDCIEDIACYARILHSVMMGTNLSDNEIHLHFNTISLLRLVDPAVYGHYYLPLLVFLPGADNTFHELSNHYSGDKEHMESVFGGDNPNMREFKILGYKPSGMALEWNRSKGRSIDLYDCYSDDMVRMYRMDAGDDLFLRKWMNSEYDDNRAVLISTPEDVIFKGDILSELGGSKFNYSVVIGNEEFLVSRDEFDNLIEIGIVDTKQLINLLDSYHVGYRNTIRDGVLSQLEGFDSDNQVINYLLEHVKHI